MTALSIAASVEQHVVHPIADAMIKHAKQQGIEIVPIKDFKAIAGFGVESTASVQGNEQKVYIGHFGFVSSKFPQQLSHALKDYHPGALEGKVMSYVLIGEALFAATFVDDIKKESLSIIKKLKDDLSIEVAMLTGDHEDNANAVAKKIGIEKVYANLRPEDKLRIVADLSKEKGLVMIGDGVNDAPALMRASVGISMGKIGSATAIDASDVVFLQDDLSMLEWLLKKSHHTVSIIKQNLCLALGVILFATTPALLGWVPLWAAVILHEGGTVLVGLNSLRLLRK
jgi:P-type E1-E2 ATPase